MRAVRILCTIAAAVVLVACGKNEPPAAASAPAPVATQAPSPAPQAVAAAAPADHAAGKAVYNKVCALCHSAGVAGAPKPGDKADWARIARGPGVLVKHAIEGYTGAKGLMPARGGASNLSDDELKAAVGYLVDASR